MPSSISMLARAVLCKREATPYTGETLTGADGITDVREFGFIAPDFKRLDNANQVKTQFGHTRAQWDKAGSVMGVDLGIPVRKPATNGAVPPDIAELLAGACGLAEQINTGVSVVYSPQTQLDLNAAPTASLEVYEAGKSYPFVGARSNLVLSAQTDQELIAKFNPRAPWADPTANAIPPSVAAPSTDVLTFTGAVAITEDGAAIDVGSIEFDLGNQVEPTPSSIGLRVLVKDNAPVVRINPLAVANAMEWDKLLTAASVAIRATWTGLVLDIPAAQLVEMGTEDRGGRFGRTKTWECLGGDSAFTLTFTA